MSARFSRTESVKFSRALGRSPHLAVSLQIVNGLIGKHNPPLVIYKHRASDWPVFCQELVKLVLKSPRSKTEKQTKQIALPSIPNQGQAASPAVVTPSPLRDVRDH